MIKKNQISAEITAAQSTAVIENVNTITDTLKDVLIITLPPTTEATRLKWATKPWLLLKRLWSMQHKTRHYVRRF